MWHNVWAVIRREYLQRVRSKWFIAATVGGPVVMAGLIFVPAWLAVQSDRNEFNLAVVDGTGVLYGELAPRLERGGFEVEEARWHADVVTDLRRRANEGEIGGFIMVDELTLETGEAIYYSMDVPSALRQVTVQTSVARAALEYQLRQQGVDAEALLGGGELQVEVISEAGSDISEPQFAIAYIGAFLLYMVILLYAVSVMRATLEEKTSRIVEVIISSMKPSELMLGKIMGVCAVSLTQMAIWIGAAIALFAGAIPMMIAARPELANLENLRQVVPGAGLMLLFLGFFLFGFLMYSGLYAAVGAMCNSDEEAQQAQFPMIMLLVVPIVMVTPVIQAPNTPMATGLSLFPLFSPILMWARVSGGGVPVWQVALSFVLMAVMVWVIAWIAGRIYKVGILMSGKRPTLPELWRWVREA
ncbi:MAG: ABC transporter permease [Gemmatimonadota bacterium]|nr:ABC transporter permease [Gemmatimonadota bacterium]MDE3005431.1 ABC transporter permease [Gemmatimonadota bacterium]MDE3012521.1 ABC transporter permease [Gemmatimonadota bacterium]